MTHPPGGPHTPPPPTGPRVTPLDPSSPEGRRIADDLARVLAEIEVQIRQREVAA